MVARKLRRMKRIIRKTMQKNNSQNENMESYVGSLESKYRQLSRDMEEVSSELRKTRAKFAPGPAFYNELKQNRAPKNEPVEEDSSIDKPNPKFQWRNFIFVKYNWKPEDEEKLRQLFKHAYAIYVMWGREICPDTGTPHLQGYCELESRMTFNPLIQLLPAGIHIEQRRGSQKQAIDYCKKDGDWEEYGVPRKQGSRSDYDIVKKNLAEGKRVIDLLTNSDDDMTMSIVKGIEQLQKYYSTRR